MSFKKKKYVFKCLIVLIMLYVLKKKMKSYKSSIDRTNKLHQSITLIRLP